MLTPPPASPGDDPLDAVAETVVVHPDEAVDELGSGRLLTVPNAVTLVRLACLPIFLYLLFGRDNRAAAGWLLGTLGATDWVDGYLARRLGQVSEFGKMFDPTVDRLLFFVGIGSMLIDGAGPAWFLILVLIREVAVGGTVAVATLAFGMQRFDVTYLGKVATFWLMFAVPGFLIGDSDFPGHTAFTVVSWILGIPGIIASYYTAVQYVPKIAEGIRSGRMARATRAGPAGG